MTDDWVVPYNPLLLMLFNCHINIEVSTHRRCFKYVYKYVFKVLYKSIPANIVQS